MRQIIKEIDKPSDKIGNTLAKGKVSSAKVGCRLRKKGAEKVVGMLRKAEILLAAAVNLP